MAQPIALSWNATASANGPIGSYTWQVSATSSFAAIIATGFTNMDSDPSVPTPTTDKVSGLPNGTYFWRVSSIQLTANGGANSPWSAARSFTVTGPGPAPAAPTFLTPVNNSQFHLVERFKISWSAVPGAQYYILEADDESTFSYPLTLSQSPITFGTQFGGLWGNALTAFYRVRAVSADGVRSLPSATLAVRITDVAPVPPGVTQVSPAAGATVTTPFFVDFTDTPNPQVPGYEVEFNASSTFANATSALLVRPSRSDYMITGDLLASGSYFWRVRALHGDVAGPWSAGRAITVQAGPTPSNVGLFAIIPPTNAFGGNPTQARVMLDNPAPAGGAVVSLSTDMRQVQMPTVTITIPAGKTDAIVTPIATGPVPNNGLSIGIIGDLFAGYANGSQQSGFGVLPILAGLGLSNESVAGGTSVNGTLTLNSAAPPGGVTVRLVSSDAGLVSVPATVFIPAGSTDADFPIATTAISASKRVYIDCGTDVDGYRAPQSSIVVTPVGTVTPAPSLSSLKLASPSVLVGDTTTGTVTLTSAAPAGGAIVTLNGSLDGQVIIPQSITVPGGALSATFKTTPAPETVFPRYVVMQAHYGTSGGSQERILEIDPIPGVSGTPTLLAVGPAGQDVMGGNQGRASVGLHQTAPVGGAVVTLTTDNPTYIHVPASVSIAEGNSTASFVIGTSPVATSPTGGRIFASAGGVTKSIFVNVTPDPNAPPILRSVAITPTTIAGGISATGTVLLSSPAPTGGLTATLASRAGVATAPGIVVIPAGQTSANFTIATTVVNTTTVDTITALVGATSQSADITVTKGAAPTPTPTPVPTATPSALLAAPSQLSPAADARFTPGANVTFDWSDVSGAASYTIQVSNQSSFSGSLVVIENVSASQFSSSTLPTQTMWWRVRANDAAGTAGNWSAGRRFEVKK